MEGVGFCMIFLLTTAVSVGLHTVVEYMMDNDSTGTGRIYSGEKPVRLQKWSYNDCGSVNAPLKIRSLEISPDPVVTPGSLYVAAMVGLKKPMVTPVQGNLTILRYSREEKRYIKLPCIGSFGSCVYQDICSLLSQISSCPEELEKIGLNCHCPIKQGAYNLKKTEFQIDGAFLTGDFVITGILTANEKEFGCLNMTITFEL